MEHISQSFLPAVNKIWLKPKTIVLTTYNCGKLYRTWRTSHFQGWTLDGIVKCCQVSICENLCAGTTRRHKFQGDQILRLHRPSQMSNTELRNTTWRFATQFSVDSPLYGVRIFLRIQGKCASWFKYHRSRFLTMNTRMRSANLMDAVQGHCSRMVGMLTGM